MDTTTDPNSPEALTYRGRQLASAVSTITQNRPEFVTDLVRGKKVLDVGCVDHDFELADKSVWLHGIIKKSASHVLGVDYDAIGVEKMRQAGYDVVQADITGDLTLVAKRGPFDVIVAGEIIEHVRAPQSVLDFAPPLLAPGGQLLITTPNPYAVWRVRNGQRGRTWENVDHVGYCFPAGMAEMADRAGLRLAQYGSIDRKAPWIGRSARVWLGAKRRGLPINAGMISPLDAIVRRVRGGPMLGETAVYVLEVQD